MYKLIRNLAVVSLIVLLGSCGDQNMASVYSPKEWRDLFSQAGGWVPLPFPDSKYEPGSIIQVNDSGIRWIDHLRSCRFPQHVLSPVRSYIPDISFTTSKELSASAMLGFKGISAGPQFQNLSKVHLQVQDHGADALRLLNLKVWMEEPANRKSVSSVCMQELLKPNRYLVTEAFRVTKASYKFFDKNGAALTLDSPLLARLLSIKPEVNHRASTDGTLIIEEPVYLAIRRALKVEDDFEVLGASVTKPESADAKIEQLFFTAN